MRWIRRYWLGVAVTLVGCSPALYVPLDAKHAAAITSTHVHATVVQEEVDPLVDSIAATNLGVDSIAALSASLVLNAFISLANTSRAEEAEELIEPLRAALLDLDFRSGFLASLQDTVPSLRVVHPASFAATKAPPGSELVTAVRGRMREDTLLLLATSYGLSTDFRTFYVATRAEIFPKSAQDPVYRATFLYLSDPMAATEREAAVAGWTSDHGAAARRAIREGIDDTMKMLVRDLGDAAVRSPARLAASAGIESRCWQAEPLPEAAGKAHATAAASPSASLMTAAAPDHTRAIVRCSDGVMYSALAEQLPMFSTPPDRSHRQ